MANGVSFLRRKPVFGRRQGHRYPTDLTDSRWAATAELVPDASPGEKPRRVASRELVNAILCMLRGGQA